LPFSLAINANKKGKRMSRSKTQSDGPGSLTPRDRPIIVHSHLRWDFVWQRPQQILSRLAAHAPVLFVEEPIFLDDLSVGRLDISVPFGNVFRALPHLPGSYRNDQDGAIAAVRSLVQESIGETGELRARFTNPIQWFYSPVTAPAMLGAFNEIAVVYDCMDELAQFKYAHPDLARRERLLLASADVVFTGGHKLYRSKSRYHANVHFFGCGVDVAHFSKARAPETIVPSDIADLPQPVFGYFGVIDERIDYELIARLAREHPDASVVMVGPVVKVDPASLPQASNIHWLGQRDYSQLPAYVKGFTTCLMPFALNEATEYINPTKTLEYMAGGKPIVSTAVADVVHNFTPVVRVANSAEEFVTLAARVAADPDSTLIAQGLRQAANSSWESIVSQMRKLISNAAGEVTPAKVEPARRTARLGELAIQ
jgi:glycosyltransferase involved in cell wall biosynthesis